MRCRIKAASRRPWRWLSWQKQRSVERRSPLTPAASCTQNQASGPTEVQSCIVEMKSTVKTLPEDHYGTGTPQTHTPKCVIDITEDANTQSSSRENSEAVSALLASQKCDAYVPESRHLVLNTSHSDAGGRMASSSRVLTA